MMLGEPHSVVAGAIHDGDALERHIVNGAERLGAVEPAEELQNADLHGASPQSRFAVAPGQVAIVRIAMQWPPGLREPLRRPPVLDALPFLIESPSKDSFLRIANGPSRCASHTINA